MLNRFDWSNLQVNKIKHQLLIIDYITLLFVSLISTLNGVRFITNMSGKKFRIEHENPWQFRKKFGNKFGNAWKFKKIQKKNSKMNTKIRDNSEKNSEMNSGMRENSKKFKKKIPNRTRKSVTIQKKIRKWIRKFVKIQKNSKQKFGEEFGNAWKFKKIQNRTRKFVKIRENSEKIDWHNGTVNSPQLCEIWHSFCASWQEPVVADREAGSGKSAAYTAPDRRPPFIPPKLPPSSLNTLVQTTNTSDCHIRSNEV